MHDVTTPDRTNDTLCEDILPSTGMQEFQEITAITSIDLQTVDHIKESTTPTRPSTSPQRLA